MPRRSSIRLTKRNVDSFVPEPGRDYTVWDAELTGFGVRVKPSGAKTFEIKYCAADGRQRKASIGRFGALTVEMARKLAQVELGKVAGGADPVADSNRAKNRMTVSLLCDWYYAEAAAGRILHRNRPKKPSTLSVDKGRIERHIKPLLGSIPIEDLKRAQVERFMFDVRDGKTVSDTKTGHRGRSIVRGGPHVGAKSVYLLSSMMRAAIRHGWVEENPCRDIDKPADGKRTRFLREEEYRAIGNAIARARDQDANGAAIDAMIALALTGCRRAEILRLTWNELDPAGRCLRLRDTKTGPQVRPCGATAFKHFANLQSAPKGEFVFPSIIDGKPLQDIRRTLRLVFDLARVEDVTPHVFRHSYATVAFELGFSELVIAGLLGHRLSSVTSRYAHRVDHVLSAAADTISETIAARMHLTQLVA